MFSGEDSSGDPMNSRNQFATWALSQAACSASKDNVDWAALAQQWIQMKESCSVGNFMGGVDSGMPIVPPPPQISSREFEEQGEAPMEVVREDETFGHGQNLSSNSSEPVGFPNPSSWQSSWYPNQTQYCPNWNTWTNSNVVPLQVPPQQIQIPPAPTINLLKDGQHSTPLLKLPGSGPSPEMSMDAAKRKTLPAWIREGLEKMEKEKLKQLEKSRGTNEQELKEQSRGESLENDLTEKKSLLFQASNDKSDEEPEDEDDVPDKDTAVVKEEYIEKTKEERIEELMLIVRQSLTELLLEVTNEEILTIAQEEFRRKKAKASSVQVVRKSAVSTITSKLGLGAYADSGSDNSESEESEHKTDDNYDSDEELKESIRARHDAFKSIAQKIEASCIESEEREYRRNADKYDRNDKFTIKDNLGGTSSITTTNGSSKKGFSTGVVGGGGGGGGAGYDNDSGETHPDKKSIINGKRLKERTSRFSSTKDSKYKTNFYPLSTTPSTAASFGTSMPSSSANIDSNKKKNKQITKRNSYSSDSSSSSTSTSSSSSSSSTSSSSDSSDSRRNSKKYRKHKSSRSKVDRTKDRDRDRDRDRSRSRSRDKNSERIRSRDRDKSSRRDRGRDRCRDEDKGISRDMEKERSRDRDREKIREKPRDRDRSKDRDSEKNHDKIREREKIREKSKERDKDKDRDREREREKDKHYKKSKRRRIYSGSRNSSDSDDYHSTRRRHHTSSYSKDRSRSSTRSNSRSRSKTRSRS